MIPAKSPSSRRIGAALQSGGLDAVEELHYPGEQARHRARTAGYTKPEGSGKPFWPEKESSAEEFEHRGDRHVGVRSRTHFYCDGVWVGYIEDVRGSRDFGSCFYRTHDGEEFAHWGGSSGAHTYLLEKYWRFGDPPKPTFMQWLRMQSAKPPE